MLCRPELDLAHPGNVRAKASMTAGVLRSDDPRFLSAQSFSRKFYVPSSGALYGLGKDCGGALFKKGPEQRCSDFWGRWTTTPSLPTRNRCGTSTPATPASSASPVALTAARTRRPDLAGGV